MENKHYKPLCRCGWTEETISDDPNLIISSYQAHLNKQEIKTWLAGGTSIVDRVYIDLDKKEHVLIPKVVSTSSFSKNNSMSIYNFNIQEKLKIIIIQLLK